MDTHSIQVTALDIANLEHILAAVQHDYYQFDVSSETWLKEFAEKVAGAKLAIAAGKRLAAGPVK